MSILEQKCPFHHCILNHVNALSSRSQSWRLHQQGNNKWQLNLSVECGSSYMKSSSHIHLILVGKFTACGLCDTGGVLLGTHGCWHHTDRYRRGVRVWEIGRVPGWVHAGLWCVSRDFYQICATALAANCWFSAVGTGEESRTSKDGQSWTLYDSLVGCQAFWCRKCHLDDICLGLSIWCTWKQCWRSCKILSTCTCCNSLKLCLCKEVFLHVCKMHFSILESRLLLNQNCKNVRTHSTYDWYGCSGFRGVTFCRLCWLLWSMLLTGQGSLWMHFLMMHISKALLSASSKGWLRLLESLTLKRIDWGQHTESSVKEESHLLPIKSNTAFSIEILRRMECWRRAKTWESHWWPTAHCARDYWLVSSIAMSKSNG